MSAHLDTPAPAALLGDNILEDALGKIEERKKKMKRRGLTSTEMGVVFEGGRRVPWALCSGYFVIRLGTALGLHATYAPSL